MGAKTDRVKGELKEKAGEITGNEKLKQQGKIDKASGRLKEAAEKTVESARKNADQCCS